MDHWYRVAKRAAWSSFADVKQSFNSVDFVAPYFIFDIGRQQIPAYLAAELYAESAVHPQHYDAQGI